MTVQRSVAVRNASLDSFETTVGIDPFLDLRTLAPPANCAAADTGVEIVHMQLPTDWLGAAAAGVKAKAGVWSGAGAAAGNVGHYRIKDTTDTTCHEQGTVTATGGGGDLELDNINIANLQVVTISTWTVTDGNA